MLCRPSAEITLRLVKLTMELISDAGEENIILVEQIDRRRRQLNCRLVVTKRDKAMTNLTFTV